MLEQKVVSFYGINDIDEKMNSVIKDLNDKGWYVKQITSHASNRSCWCLLFEREVK